MLLTAIINDVQIPYQDTDVLSTVVDFIRDLKPDSIILCGDIVDCYNISEFNKNPLTKESLADEIELAEDLMAEFFEVPHKLWIGGNHEDRLRRYIWQHASAFAVLPELQFENLFHLEDYGFEWIPYGAISEVGKLIVTHGDLVRKDSGGTARAHFEKFGQSVLTGHTHRLAAYYKTRINKVSVAYENGCLCRLDPEYVRNPDWQQGFSVVHHDPITGEFHVQQMPIFNTSNGKVFYYGEERVVIGGA